MKITQLLLVMIFGLVVAACGGGGGGTGGGGNTGGGTISATANTTAQNLTVGTAMTSFSPLTVSGGATPYTYSYTGTLPAGLSFNAGTGAVTGTPTAAYATANLVFSVKDANNVTASTTSTVSFSVIAGTGVTLSGNLSGIHFIANSHCSNGICVAGGNTLGVLVQWNDASGATTSLIYNSNYNSITIVFDVVGSVVCGVASSITVSGTTYPACSNNGIAFNRSAGIITFSSALLNVLPVPPITATGSLTFAPF